MFEAVVNTDVSKNVYTMFEIVGLSSWDIQYGVAVIFIFRLFMSVMFMNMLISIIMGHYGSIRALPENQDLINAKEANAYVETYRSMKLSIQSLFTKAPYLYHDGKSGVCRFGLGATLQSWESTVSRYYSPAPLLVLTPYVVADTRHAQAHHRLLPSHRCGCCRRPDRRTRFPLSQRHASPHERDCTVTCELVQSEYDGETRTKVRVLHGEFASCL